MNELEKRKKPGTEIYRVRNEVTSWGQERLWNGYERMILGLERRLRG